MARRLPPWKQKGFKRKPRVPKANPWYPFKNEFEKIIDQTLVGWDYENKKRKVKYVIEATYNPDFTTEGDLDWLLIEAKGRFRGGSAEAAKYVWVKRSHPKLEILFLFDNHNNIAYPGCRRRKDGSYLTMGEWAAKNGFVFFNARQIPPELAAGDVDREWYERIKQRQHEMYFGK